MENTEQLKHKYTCKYCKKVFNEPIRECPGCGSTEFLETTYIVASKKKRTTAIVIVIVAIISVLVVLGAIGRSGENESAAVDDYELSDYTSKEYAYDDSLLTNPELYLGKNNDSAQANYYLSIKVTGKYRELYDNIFNNVYSSQFRSFTFVIPCDVELEDGDFHAEITALEFGYYGGNTENITLEGFITGKTDKDISIYLVDENGNKDKLLIDEYKRDKYRSVAEYLCSDEYRKRFDVNNVFTEYKTLLIEFGDTSQEYEINYDRGSGSIQYYALK